MAIWARAGYSVSVEVLPLALGEWRCIGASFTFFQAPFGERLYQMTTIFGEALYKTTSWSFCLLWISGADCEYCHMSHKNYKFLNDKKQRAKLEALAPWRSGMSSLRDSLKEIVDHLKSLVWNK